MKVLICLVLIGVGYILAYSMNLILIGLFLIGIGSYLFRHFLGE